MRRSTLGAVICLLAVPLLATCNGSDDGGVPCNDDGSCDGSYVGFVMGANVCSDNVVQMGVAGDQLMISDFPADCSNLPVSPPCFDCIVVTEPVAFNIDNGCNFRAQMEGDGEHGRLRLVITGTLDTDSCSLEGEYDLEIGSCCSFYSFTWHAD